jgi:hypothetical protein
MCERLRFTTASLFSDEHSGYGPNATCTPHSVLYLILLLGWRANKAIQPRSPFRPTERNFGEVWEKRAKGWRAAPKFVQLTRIPDGTLVRHRLAITSSTPTSPGVLSCELDGHRGLDPVEVNHSLDDGGWETILGRNRNASRHLCRRSHRPLRTKRPSRASPPKAAPIKLNGIRGSGRARKLTRCGGSGRSDAAAAVVARPRADPSGRLYSGSVLPSAAPCPFCSGAFPIFATRLLSCPWNVGTSEKVRLAPYSRGTIRWRPV